MTSTADIAARMQWDKLDLEFGLSAYFDQHETLMIDSDGNLTDYAVGPLIKEYGLEPLKTTQGKWRCHTGQDVSDQPTLTAAVSAAIGLQEGM